MRDDCSGLSRKDASIPLTLLCVLLLSTTGSAQDPLPRDPAEPSQTPRAGAPAAGESDTDAETAAADTDPEDRCDWLLEGQPIQERSREFFRGVACHSFRWFDSMWGDRYDFDEASVNGLVTLGGEYSEYPDFESRFRFRVRAPLPNLSSRWDLILGRVDEQAYISDTESHDRLFADPVLIDRDEEAEWLLGLGHRGKAGKSGWDYSAGVRLRVPPRPYVKAQYYYNLIFSEKTDLRFRQTFFWRSQEGFGTTSRGDLAYRINPTDVLRWEGFMRFSEETEGTDWYLGQTWYHQFAGQNAFSLRSFVRGATSAPVELKEFGLKFIWRRPLTRDWLYLSVGPTVSWPRERIEERRELSLGVLAWIEIEFGEWRY